MTKEDQNNEKKKLPESDKKNHNKQEMSDEINTENENNSDQSNKNISPEEEIENLKDKLARTFAEMENQRRRFEKEKDDAFEYGGISFAREALNLLDNLERSKVSLENDETLKNTDALKKIMEHLEVINKDMLSIFKKNSIEPIKSINEKLDPNFHQAMIEIEDEIKEPGTIVQEIQKGFMMKDRLLRPSLVAVSKKKNDTKEENDKKDQENQVKND